MIRRLIFAIAFMVGVISSIFAQNLVEEVVYLKNGSIIRGVIIEQIPNKTIKIETRDGNVFVYSMNEVEKITKDAASRQHRRRNAHENKPVVVRKSGPSGMIQFMGLGYIEPSTYSEGAFLESQFIYGYRFNPYLFLGGGVGLEHIVGDFDYEYSTSYNLRIPLFTALKLNLSKTRVSPFFQFDLGYKLNSNDNFSNGAFFLPKFGLDFNLGQARRRALFLTLSVGEYGKTDDWDYYYYYDNDGDYEFYPKVGINFGLRF